ncbi:MAG: sulfite exporter TauE/SafE family protein [Gammaproteobacteria bacterium]|nr:sulfite exporter TauE/SafE family protein [Gammaproteobacteria bacterium]
MQYHDLSKNSGVMVLPILESCTLLFLLGLCTSCISSTTGGSAFINVPIMIFLGFPPTAAIASARMTAVGTSLAGISQFHKFGKIDYKLAWPAALLSIAGAVMGALFTTKLSDATLNHLIGGITLTLLFLSYFLRRKAGAEVLASRTRRAVGYSLFLITSTVGGVFGGMGMINTYIFMMCFHKKVVESIGTRKVVTLAVSIAAALVYGVHGFINWYAVAALMAGTVIGTIYATGFMLRKGDRFIEIVFMLVTFVMGLKLLISVA